MTTEKKNNRSPSIHSLPFSVSFPTEELCKPCQLLRRAAAEGFAMVSIYAHSVYQHVLCQELITETSQRKPSQIAWLLFIATRRQSKENWTCFFFFSFISFINTSNHETIILSLYKINFNNQNTLRAINLLNRILIERSRFLLCI